MDDNNLLKGLVRVLEAESKEKDSRRTKVNMSRAQSYDQVVLEAPYFNYAIKLRIKNRIRTNYLRVSLSR